MMTTGVIATMATMTTMRVAMGVSDEGEQLSEQHNQNPTNPPRCREWRPTSGLCHPRKKRVAM